MINGDQQMTLNMNTYVKIIAAEFTMSHQRVLGFNQHILVF